VAVVCVVLVQPIYVHRMKELRTFSAKFAIMEGRGPNFRLHYFLNISVYVFHVGISYMKYVNGRRTLLVTFCGETAFYNGLLKER
jgi:hypothetical protein